MPRECEYGVVQLLFKPLAVLVEENFHPSLLVWVLSFLLFFSSFFLFLFIILFHWSSLFLFSFLLCHSAFVPFHR